MSLNSGRRTFLSLFSKAVLSSTLIPPFLSSCGNYPNRVILEGINSKTIDFLRSVPVIPVDPTDKDDLILAQGLNYQKIISWEDPISKNDYFGYNNDFTCFVPLGDSKEEGLLWVNHEYVNSFFINDLDWGDKKTKEQVEKEMYNVGGSIVHIKKKDGKWLVIEDSEYNRRITGLTPIPLNWDEPLAGKSTVMGTNSNCSGGLTPWGTILTCEENFQDYFGELKYENNQVVERTKGPYQWQDYYPFPSEHYGWVVEVDPITGNAQKHIALGRFSHECCTLYRLDDDRIVAYSGDDKKNEFIYKFVSSKPNSLKEGTLYVADTINGKWLSLNLEESELLKKHFLSQTEVLIRCREAARIVGATPQNRPEDIEIDPLTGEVYIALTNNSKVDDDHGSILKIDELGDYSSDSFKSETFISGGTESGLTCPDNLCFDLAGNLWVCSDMSTSKMNNPKGPYYPDFKNNALFVIPRHGAMAGRPIQVASAPRDAELTGPWFSPDFKTLFISVQHPGEKSTRGDLTSHWPANDGVSMPRPSVIAIEGDLLDKFMYLDKMVMTHG